MGFRPFSRKITACLVVLSVLMGTFTTYAVSHVGMYNAASARPLMLFTSPALNPPHSIQKAFGPEFPEFTTDEIQEYHDTVVSAYGGWARSIEERPRIRNVGVVLAGWPMRAIRVDETEDEPYLQGLSTFRWLPTNAFWNGTRTILPLGYAVNSAVGALAWFTVLSILVLCLQFVTGHLRRTRTATARRTGKCPSCGYHKQTLATCPECGQTDPLKE